MQNKYQYKKLGDICDKASSNVAQNKIEGLDGDFPIFGASGYIQNVNFYHQDKTYIGVVKDGSGVGRVNIYPAQSSLLGTMQYVIPKEGYNIGFVAYVLKSLKLSSFATGAAIPHIYFKDYGQCMIPVPPLEEQERIVAELDLLTGVIEKQKAQLKELDNLAQSIFYDMFGDVVNNEKAWNVVPLRLLCSITSSKRIFASEYCQSGIPFFRGKEVSEKSFGLKTSVELFISKKRYDEIRDAYGVPSMGDILLTAVGTIGNVWVVDDDAPFYFKDGNILWLKLREGINPVYFRFVLLKLVDAYKSSMAKGCAYNALTIVNLKEMPTVDTPYCFQNEFAHKIQSIENQKTLIKKSIEETQKLFDYTMDKYFG